MTDLWPALATTAKATPTTTHDDDDLTADLTRFFETAAEHGTTHICPTCQDADAIDKVDSEVVCTRCGTLVDIPIEMTAEYRYFSADAATTGDPSRCSFPINPLMPESSLSTMINTRGRSSALGRRIRRYHMWNLMPYRERNLWTVFESLQVRAANAGISTAVIEEAKELYAQLTATIVCRGQPQRDAILAACLWEALKRHDAPRMPRDIAEIFCIPIQAVTRGIRQFQHTLAIRTSARATDTYTSVGAGAGAAAMITSTSSTSSSSSSTAAATAVPTPPPASETEATLMARAHQRLADIRATASRTTSYEDFIGPFLTNISPPREQAAALESMVRTTCRRIDELGIVPENTPPSLTASVIAFCCAERGIRIDHGHLARVCGISAVTITKCLKRLQPWRERILAAT
jgi:transcription initiation factor TFIIIB Brf1 subunit/transcription initiation factor TFIIB